MSRKAILTIAPAGAMGDKVHKPHLPTAPEEIREAAGASMATAQARRSDDITTIWY